MLLGKRTIVQLCTDFHTLDAMKLRVFSTSSGRGAALERWAVLLVAPEEVYSKGKRPLLKFTLEVMTNSKPLTTAHPQLHFPSTLTFPAPPRFKPSKEGLSSQPFHQRISSQAKIASSLDDILASPPNVLG